MWVFDTLMNLTSPNYQSNANSHPNRSPKKHLHVQNFSFSIIEFPQSEQNSQQNVGSEDYVDSAADDSGPFGYVREKKCRYLSKCPILPPLLPSATPFPDDRIPLEGLINFDESNVYIASPSPRRL